MHAWVSECTWWEEGKEGIQIKPDKKYLWWPKGKNGCTLGVRETPQAADLDSLPPKQGPEVVPMGADTNTELKASSLPSLTVPSCVTCLCNWCDKGS